MKEKPNLTYINKLSGKNKLFKKQVLAIIKKELPLEIESYDLYLSQRDYLKTAETVHKLKHKISILGLEEGHQVAVDYENQLKNEKSGLKEGFEEILEEMLRFIKKT